MARFRATIKGQRGKASRLESESGIRATVNGWGVGVRVESLPGSLDHFEVTVTGGSRAEAKERVVGRVFLNASGMPVWLPVWQHD
jgi:hypothetical protein